MESAFSKYFKQAFNSDLIVHRNAGNEVPLYVGDKPIVEPGQDRISIQYLKKLELLDLLHLQGDGMRSFVGVLLNTIVAQFSIFFIDEPEAFLHPPQAYLLGRMLNKDLPQDKQIFIATHSADFIKGLLDANPARLKIIRLTRDGNTNNSSVLDSSAIKDVWADSLLRHSNILNALFHNTAIICESDSDCRFYSAVFYAIYEDSGMAVPDVLFINCGGKHRIPTVIRALNRLNVNLRVVSDFDVLNDINPIKEIFENLSGSWGSVNSDWRLVKNEIDGKRPSLPTVDLKREIQNIFDSTQDVNFPKDKILEIQRQLKKASAWSEAKSVGKAFIPSGNASQAFDRIQANFQEKGFYILDVGELESFVRSVGNHGPKWVSEVLRKDLKTDPELEQARQFVARLVS